MRTGLTKQEKTTDIWFDEKDPLIHIRTHNTDLKRRLAAYAEQYPDECCKTDTDPETGCMEFDIAAVRLTQTPKQAAWSLILQRGVSLSV